MPRPSRLAFVLVALTAGLVVPAGIGADAAHTSEVAGTARADTLIGTAKADVIRGMAGDDTLTGRRGSDVLRGMQGQDDLVGGPGADRLYGGAGHDRIDGRDTAPRATTGSRRARVCPQPSRASRCIPLPDRADLINAGPGDDIVQARDGHPDAIICGPGQDLVVADPTDLFSASTPRSGCESIDTAP